MTCEICGTELTDDTISNIDENKCSMCAPDVDEDGEEMNMDLDEDLDMEMDL